MKGLGKHQILVITTLLLLILLSILAIKYTNTSLKVKNEGTVQRNIEQPQSYSFPYRNLPVLGSPNAPIKIIELGDFKCPSCKVWESNIFPKLKKDYVETGKVSFYFMNLPILGPDSTRAALAAESIFHQNNDAFWEYYTSVYNNQGKENSSWATPEFLLKIATENVPGIDYKQLKKDIDDQTYLTDIQNERTLCFQYGIYSTPTIFVNEKPVSTKNFEDLRRLVDDELARGGTK